jgi:hypothetical protein
MANTYGVEIKEPNKHSYSAYRKWAQFWASQLYHLPTPFPSFSHALIGKNAIQEIKESSQSKKYTNL